MPFRPVVQVLANAVQVAQSDPQTFMQVWHDLLCQLEKNELPSGSGFDCGSWLVMEKSNPQKLVFMTEFHHMNEGGFYDGWTRHEVIVTPNFHGFDVKVTGRDKRQIKEYIGDMFHDCLRRDIETYMVDGELSYNVRY